MKEYFSILIRKHWLPKLSQEHKDEIERKLKNCLLYIIKIEIVIFCKDHIPLNSFTLMFSKVYLSPFMVYVQVYKCLNYIVP